jgi:hypothetical protein
VQRNRRPSLVGTEFGQPYNFPNPAKPDFNKRRRKEISFDEKLLLHFVLTLMLAGLKGMRSRLRQSCRAVDALMSGK